MRASASARLAAITSRLAAALAARSAWAAFVFWRRPLPTGSAAGAAPGKVLGGSRYLYFPRLIQDFADKFQNGIDLNVYWLVRE